MTNRAKEEEVIIIHVHPHHEEYIDEYMSKFSVYLFVRAAHKNTIMSRQESNAHITNANSLPLSVAQTHIFRAYNFHIYC